MKLYALDTHLKFLSTVSTPLYFKSTTKGMSQDEQQSLVEVNEEMILELAQKGRKFHIKTTLATKEDCDRWRVMCREFFL